MIDLYRASGHPVDSKEDYLKELNKRFDELEAQKTPMEEVTKELDKFHEEYTTEHPIKIKVKLPKTERDFKNFVKKHGPALAFCIENDRLVAYILDQDV